MKIKFYQLPYHWRDKHHLILDDCENHHPGKYFFCSFENEAMKMFLVLGNTEICLAAVWCVWWHLTLWTDHVSFKCFLFYFIFKLCVYVIFVYGYEHMLVHCPESRQGVESPEAGLNGNCELPNMSSGNWTWALWYGTYVSSLWSHAF